MNEQFAEWFKDKWYSDDWEQLRESGVAPAEFDCLPFCMKWGAYVEFFDILGIQIEVWRLQKWEYNIVCADRICTYIEGETRQIAQESAIKKAFEILEKQPKLTTV